jgi:acylphosphatase
VLQAYAVLAIGRVQGVQFRKTVRDLARESGLVGKVENLADGNVRIIVQGDDSKIDTFLGNLRMLPDPIKVADLQKSSIPLDVGLKIFEIRYGEMGSELEESMSAGLGQLKVLTSEMSQFRTDTSQDFRTLNTKYDSISNTLAMVVQQSAETSNELKKSIDSLLKSLDNLSLLAQAYFEDRRKEFTADKS